jgi:hypothetical protein
VTAITDLISAADRQRLEERQAELREVEQLIREFLRAAAGRAADPERPRQHRRNDALLSTG